VPGVARTPIVLGLTEDGAAVDGVGGTLRLTVDPTTEPDEDEATDPGRPRAEGVAEVPVRERCVEQGNLYQLQSHVERARKGPCRRTCLRSFSACLASSAAWIVSMMRSPLMQKGRWCSCSHAGRA
jgi:hypothetical protein